MKIIVIPFLAFGALSFPVTLSLAEDKRTVVVKPTVIHAQLDLASMSSKLSAVVKAKKATTKEDHFKIVDCDAGDLKNPVLEFTGKCFELHTAQKNKSAVQAPIVIVNATGPKGFDTAKGTQGSQNEMDWGQISTWSTGAKASFIFLAPKEKEQMVRIGPVPASVLSQYDIEWKIDPW